jgi:hypothetical protein
MRNEYTTLLENLKGIGHLEDVGVDGIILKRSLKKGWRVWTDSYGSGKTGGGLF